MIQGSTAQQLTQQEHAHLSGGRYRVYMVMKDGQWRTLWQIQRAVKERFNTYYSETTISARLRDLRKARHGGHTVHHRTPPASARRPIRIPTGGGLMGRKRKQPEVVPVPVLKTKFDIGRVHRRIREPTTQAPVPPPTTLKPEPKT